MNKNIILAIIIMLLDIVLLVVGTFLDLNIYIKLVGLFVFFAIGIADVICAKRYMPIRKR